MAIPIIIYSPGFDVLELERTFLEQNFCNEKCVDQCNNCVTLISLRKYVMNITDATVSFDWWLKFHNRTRGILTEDVKTLVKTGVPFLAVPHRGDITSGMKASHIIPIKIFFDARGLPRSVDISEEKMDWCIKHQLEFEAWVGPEDGTTLSERLKALTHHAKILACSSKVNKNIKPKKQYPKTPFCGMEKMETEAAAQQGI